MVLSHASLCDFSSSIRLVSSCTCKSICCGLFGELLLYGSCCWLTSVCLRNVTGNGEVDVNAGDVDIAGEGRCGDTKPLCVMT